MTLHPAKWLPRISQTSPIRNLFMASVKIGLWWKFIAVFSLKLRIGLLPWCCDGLATYTVHRSRAKSFKIQWPFNVFILARSFLISLLLSDRYSEPGPGCRKPDLPVLPFQPEFGIIPFVHKYTTQRNTHTVDSTLLLPVRTIPQNSKINQNYLRTL